MVRLIALYNQPADPDAFDTHYRAIHAPIVRRYPGLTSLSLIKPDGVGSRPPDYYLVAEMGFATRADLDAALASEAGRESGRDLRNFAQAGVTLLIVDETAALADA